MDVRQPGPEPMDAQDGPHPERSPAALRSDRVGRRRRVLFRIGAVMLGFVPFVLGELLLMLFGWGDPNYQVDPFVGFRSVRPLFVLNAATGRYEIPRSRQTFFRPDGFSAEKAADGFRIFCLGGSTVQGRPWAIETSFSTWLEIGLRAADPRYRWEVVNCGGVSYASYRLVPILEEVIGYAPDLIVIYTGHNEFLEDRSYDHIISQPAALRRTQEILLQTRSYSLLCAGYDRLRCQAAHQRLKQRPVLEAEVQALLDYRGGLEAYQRDDRWRRRVMDHFQFNLRRMVRLAQDAGVPLVLANPVSNIRDCPPFKVQHGDGLTPAQVQQWDRLCAAARSCFQVNKYQAIDLYHQAIAMDNQHAGVYYNLGKCYDELNMPDLAHQAYLQAKELDISPLRMLEPMQQAVLQVARLTGTPVVDVRQLIERCSRDGIPGRDWLIDHIHPTIPGHQRIADAIIATLKSLGIVHPVPGAEQRRRRKYREHLASLDRSYDRDAAERLGRLRRWAQGRARRLRTPAKTTSAPPPAPGTAQSLPEDPG